MKNLKKSISPYLTFIFLAAFLAYFFRNIDNFKPLLDVPPGLLFLIVLAKLFTFLAGGIFLKWTVEVFTAKMRLLEGIYVAVLSALGNYFGPLLGGATIRAVYLKKVHKLSYSKFTSTLFGYYIIVFMSISVLALISLLLLPQTSLSKSLTVFFGAWLVALILIVVLPFPSRKRFHRIEEGTKIGKAVVSTFFDVEEGWHMLRKNRRLILKLCCLTVLSTTISLLATKIEFYALGVTVSLPSLGLYTAISVSSLLVSLTPGGIGIQESLLILSASLLGVTNAQILSVAVIDRGVSFILLGIMFFTVRAVKSRSSLMRTIQDDTAS